jgi:thioredoxin 1
MKKIIKMSALALITMGFMVRSYEIKPAGGIKFSHLSLEKAKEQAKKEEKIIFIDCYTSWCGPCKQMAATTFQNEGVAKIYNSKFVNLKVDIEKDSDGPEIARKYKISAYPTLLYIDETGKLVKSMVGMQSADKMLAVANEMQ